MRIRNSNNIDQEKLRKEDNISNQNLLDIEWQNYELVAFFINTSHQMARGGVFFGG